MNQEKKSLGLFFTYGISLTVWEKVGNLEREIKPYLKLLDFFDDIYFFTYGDQSDIDILKKYTNKIKVFPKKHSFLPNFLYTFLIPFFYKKEIKKITVLKTNQMKGGWTAVLAKFLYQKKLLVRCGFEWLDFALKQKKSSFQIKITEMIEEFVYKNADKISITSKEDREFIIKKFKLDENLVKVIPNYIDIDVFKPLILEKKPKSLIFIGRFNEQKNLFSLFDAINGLEISLTMVGAGELKSELEDKASKIEIAKINFLGKVKNSKLPELISKHEVFILPSFYEGNPKVLLEAMSCGATIIATDVKGSREVVQHQKNAYVCQTDSKSIRNAVKEILFKKNNPETLGVMARKTIEENFSLEKVVEREIKIYQKLCQN